MKNCVKYAVLNGSMVVGFFLAIFLLPPNSHFWPVLIAFLVFLAVSNYGLFRRQRASTSTSNRADTLTIAVIVLFILLFDLLLSRVHL